VTLEGDFPINYLVYQPQVDQVVVEVRDCDASLLRNGLTQGSSELKSFETSTTKDAHGTIMSHFTFHLEPGVTHEIQPVENNLVLRFHSHQLPAGRVSGIQQVPEIRHAIQEGHSSPRGGLAPAMAPQSQPSARKIGAPATAIPLHLRPDEEGLIAYNEIDLAGYTNMAGLPAMSPARALVGLDTASVSSGKIVLLLDGPAAYASFELAHPLRLVIDMADLTNEITRSVIPIQSPHLRRIRVSQFSDAPRKIARVVLDLTRATDYEIEPSAEGLVITLQRASLKLREPLDVAQLQPAAPQEAVRHGSGSHSVPSVLPLAPAVVEGTTRLKAADGGPAKRVPAVQKAIALTAAQEVAADEAVQSHVPAQVAQESAGVTAAPAGIAKSPAAAAKAAAPAEPKDASIPAASSAGQPAPLNPTDYAFYDEARPEVDDNRGPAKAGAGLTFESKTISDERPVYTGRRISLELVDADLKQVFRLFHEISGLNFVLDPSVGGKVTIVLDDVPWDQALDIILRNNGLDKIFDNNVIRIATTARLAGEAQERRSLKEASRLEVDPVTVSRILSYARAEDIDPIVRRMLSSRGQSFYDKRTNTVIVTDIPEKVEAVNNLMDDLDARTPQVMIEARIVETSREFTRDLGIQWGFATRDQRGAGNNFSSSFDLNLPRVAGASRLGLSFGDLGPNGFNIDLALDALETEGRGRILSAPKIVAQNNTTAVIEQGVQIPVVNTTATEINVEFISASLKLEVTPQITAEGTVILDIKVDNSSPDFLNRVDQNPAINTERASTRVLVQDGGTTVIGGVFLLNEGESETGIPGLRKIPGLGWLFRNRNITKENRELLIFITPKITL
ncbi:MAG: type IV pilus secretin PilQ, partial [Acidobacteriota bacterium]